MSPLLPPPCSDLDSDRRDRSDGSVCCSDDERQHDYGPSFDGDGTRYDHNADSYGSSRDAFNWRSWFPDISWLPANTYFCGDEVERPSWLRAGASHDPLMSALAKRRKAMGSRRALPEAAEAKAERAAKRATRNQEVLHAWSWADEQQAARDASRVAAEEAYSRRWRSAQEEVCQAEVEAERARRAAQEEEEERQLQLFASERMAKRAMRASMQQEQRAVLTGEMLAGGDSTSHGAGARPSSSDADLQAPPGLPKRAMPQPTSLSTALGTTSLGRAFSAEQRDGRAPPAQASAAARPPLLSGSTALPAKPFNFPRALRGDELGSRGHELGGGGHELVVARGVVSDAAALLGPSGQRLNALREKHRRVSIQLTNGLCREIIVRGPRAEVASVVIGLRSEGRARIEMPTPPATALATKRSAAALSCDVPVPKLAAPFIQAVRGEPHAVRAAASAASAAAARTARDGAQPAAVGDHSGAVATARKSASEPKSRKPAGSKHTARHAPYKRRVPWSATEERALRQGMQKHGAGKWQAILLDGGFHACRTNVDLKDKARNMRL